MKRCLIFLLIAFLPMLSAAGQSRRVSREEAMRPVVPYETLFASARSQAHAGQYESALKGYSRLLDRYPADADGLLGRGRVLAWMGRYEDARADLQLVTERYPDYADAWLALGNLCLWSSNASEAEEAYTIALGLDPTAEILLQRARARMADRRYGPAREDLRAGLDLGADPGRVDQLLAVLGRVPPAGDWELRLGGSLDRFEDENREDWRCAWGQVGRRLPAGRVFLGMENWDRGDKRENRGVADLYYDLWSGAYGNLRAAIAPGAETLPESDLLLDLYQALGPGWELNLGGRRLDVPGQPVSILGLGLGRYQGDWTLRLRLSGTVQGEDTQLGVLLSARRTLGRVDDFLELTGGHSRASFASESFSADDGGWLVLLRAQKYLTASWGLGLDLEANSPGEGSDMHSLRLVLLFHL